MIRFARGDRKAPLLIEFRLETSETKADYIILDERGLPFRNTAPSLQQLALCCDIFLIQLRPDSNTSLVRRMFPNLRELELAKMGSTGPNAMHGNPSWRSKFTRSEVH